MAKADTFTDRYTYYVFIISILCCVILYTIHVEKNNKCKLLHKKKDFFFSCVSNFMLLLTFVLFNFIHRIYTVGYDLNTSLCQEVQCNPYYDNNAWEIITIHLLTIYLTNEVL